jgi:hypothetical protein
MRLHLLTTALALSSMIGCSKSPLSANAPTTTATPAQVYATPAPSSASSRHPKQNSSAVTAVAPKPTPVRHLAPEGTYFLLQFVSITTPSGVVGLPPGTKITALARDQTSFKVSDADDHAFLVMQSQITNDLDLAAAAARRDAALQSRIQNQIATEARKYEEEQAKRWAQEQNAAKQRTPPKPSPR